jgi:hypothetical protein
MTDESQPVQRNLLPIPLYPGLVAHGSVTSPSQCAGHTPMPFRCVTRAAGKMHAIRFIYLGGGFPTGD